MQWSVLTEGKQKNELAQKEFHFIKTIITIRRGNYPVVFASISALHFKVAIESREMQWGHLTEGKQKNELAQKEFRFIKITIIIRGGNYSSSFASISALHCSKRRQTSRWPRAAEKCSGVR
jgi:hypothetical protein